METEKSQDTQLAAGDPGKSFQLESETLRTRRANCVNFNPKAGRFKTYKEPKFQF